MRALAARRLWQYGRGRNNLHPLRELLGSSALTSKGPLLKGQNAIFRIRGFLVEGTRDIAVTLLAPVKLLLGGGRSPTCSYNKIGMLRLNSCRRTVFSPG